MKNKRPKPSLADAVWIASNRIHEDFVQDEHLLSTSSDRPSVLFQQMRTTRGKMAMINRLWSLVGVSGETITYATLIDQSEDVLRMVVHALDGQDSRIAEEAINLGLAMVCSREPNLAHETSRLKEQLVELLSHYPHNLVAVEALVALGNGKGVVV